MRAKIVVAVGLLLCLETSAAELEVRVVDRDGEPVRGVVVAVEPIGAAPSSRSNPAVEQMIQRNLSFEPHVLVVQTGTPISFPNQDNVKHHVYSFSPAKTFQLSLYSGTEHPPETFDRAGLVTLGCNIHDAMIGYVYVTDSPHFGKTSEAGALNLTELDPGAYRITLWHPRIKDAETNLVAETSIAADRPTVVPFTLTRKLKPERSNNPTSKWSDY